MESVRIKNVAVTILIVCLSLVQVSHGADANGNYRVMTTDLVKSCAALNAAVTLAQVEDSWAPLHGFSLYTMGYLTAVNRLAFDTYDLAAGKNPKNLLLWLERYCEAHPGKSTDEALHELVKELYPTRRAYPG